MSVTQGGPRQSSRAGGKEIGVLGHDPRECDLPGAAEGNEGFWHTP
jgi:hypothetical protein